MSHIALSKHWDRTGTTLEPKISGDNLDMGTGDVNAANVDVSGNYQISNNRILAIDSGTRSQLFVGYQAGLNTEIDGDAYRNTAIGHDALKTNIKGDYNTAVGFSSLSLNANDADGLNTAIGAYSLWQATGAGNTGLGSYVGYNQSGGNNNVLIGSYAGNGGPSGTYAKSNNTMIGYASGHNCLTGDGNVFLGYMAGLDETGSNKLYIENSNSASPLIYGEFDTDIVAINGTLSVNTSSPLYSLHVAANSSNLAVGLLLDNETGGATSGTGIRFRSSSGEATDIRCKSAVLFERTDAGGVGSLHLAVEGTNDDSNAAFADAKLTIDKDGDVFLANNLTIGSGAAGIDYTLTFDGEDNDGVITWLEDEDAFDMSCGFSLNAGQIVTEFSTDGTLAGDSDAAIPTEKAVKKYVDDTAGGLNYWTRAVTTISPLTAGDDLDMGSGTITTTGKITGGDLDVTGTTTTLLGTSIDTTGGNFTVNGTGDINIATDANTNTVNLASGAGIRAVNVGGANTDLELTGYDFMIRSVELHFSAIDGKGELIVCDGTKSRALIVGNNDEVLTADSATSTGLKWAAIPSVYWTRAVTTISPLTAGDDLDMGSGEIITTDTITCGDLYIAGSTPTLRFNDSNSDNYFIKTDGDDELHFSSDEGGDNAYFRFFSKDGDGTDTVAINLFGVGSSSDYTNQEALKIEYNTGYELFQIYSSNTGTGTLQALRLGAGTYVTQNQLSLSTDGRVGMTVAAPLAQLHIDQKEDDEAIPVLALDQADISEGFINFIGSDRGVITGATDSVESVRVEVNGTVRRIAVYADA